MLVKIGLEIFFINQLISNILQKVFLQFNIVYKLDKVINYIIIFRSLNAKSFFDWSFRYYK